MSKNTAFIFFGIILAGLIGSLVYFNMRGDVVEVGGEPQPLASLPDGESPKSGEKGAKPAAPGPGKPATPGKAPAKKSEPKAPLAPGTAFATPEAAMKALGDSVGAKNFDSFLKFVGEGAIAVAARPAVKNVIEAPGLSLSKEKPVVEISKSADSVRWALNFVPEVGEAGKQLYADMTVEGKNSFTISRISLPLEISTLDNGSKPGAPSTPGSPKSASPTAPTNSGIQGVDALTVAHAFSKAVVERNFKAARALADSTTVTDERVAALMIAIEEGDYALKEDRPLVVTLSREDITWVLTRVQSDKSGSEFALELGQVGDSWAVNGLTFSKVLSALSEQAGAGKVAYSPIVEDPMGGDSLVLYFEFDQAALSPRGNRQLAIIADILSQGAERVIRINGHADALGTDDYNSALSDKRAAAIRNGLISMGVSPSQVVTEAFGETKPRRPNFNPDGTDNPTGRSQNRRAEVYLDF